MSSTSDPGERIDPSGESVPPGDPNELPFGPVDEVGRQALRLPLGLSNRQAFADRTRGLSFPREQVAAVFALTDCWSRLAERPSPSSQLPPPRPGQRASPIPLPVVAAHGGRSLLPEFEPWWTEVDPWADARPSPKDARLLTLQHGGFSSTENSLDGLAPLTPDQRIKAEELRAAKPAIFSLMFSPNASLDFDEIYFPPRLTSAATLTMTGDALLATATIQGNAKGSLEAGLAGHTFGVRMPFYSICHVEIELIHSVERPLIGKAAKAVFDSRGYGGYSSFGIEIIATDGWGYLRFRGLSSSALPEEEAKHWMTAVPRTVASDRLRCDWLDDDERARSMGLSTEPPIYEPGPRKSEHRIWVSQFIPAPRSVSVP